MTSQASATSELRSLNQWHRGVPLSAKPQAIVGLAILLLWLGGFGVWAGLAPLQGAVVASGTFVATGQNKLVQHLEGGIIRDLLVTEGDLVEADQVLVRMDDTAARAKLRRLILRKYRLLTMQARLQAEMQSSDALEMPAALAPEAADPEVKAIFERQRTELQARRASLAAEELVLKKEIAGLEESIRGYEAQVQATGQRLALFAEELKDKTTLLERQLARKTEVLSLRRAEAALAGEIGELTGRIADARERIARANQRIAHLHSAAIQRAVQELRETETELDDILEQARAARDVAERVEVRAPAKGVVVKRHFHTPGGVVAPGAVIVELLPLRDELVIEARVNPNDVSHVAVGQAALARLSALNQRITPMIEATVIYLSADALSAPPQQMTTSQQVAKAGQESQRDFYMVRVRLDEADVRKRIDRFRPTPGMPADVYIKTNERTFFEYIMRPVLDSFSRAFREQ
jgi:HlyD family type I secretion membrane fusion protein